MQALRRARIRFDLRGLVQIHHILPRQHACHPTLVREAYCVERSDNLMFMPTRMGANVLRLRDNRHIHDGGHVKYNAFIKDELDVIANKQELNSFITFLNYELRRSNSFLPWR